MWSSVFLLCSCFSFIWSEDADNFVSDEIGTWNGAVARASSWILSQQTDDLSWGTLTPRAVVALEMASSSGVAPLSATQKDILVKQLNILLSLELGKDPSTKAMTLSRLASFVNALLSTCQNPRQFHGLDLVQALSTRAYGEDRDKARLLPSVFLTLCLAGDRRQGDDLNTLWVMYQKHWNRTDLQALDVMAFSCITRQKRAQRNDMLNNFEKRFSMLPPAPDVYTLALAIQALHSAGRSANISALALRQLPDGSFGSLLATYLAIPALMGKSLLDLGCKNTLDRISTPTLSGDTSMRVHYSLWIGEKDERDSHKVTIVTPSANVTFLDVMKLAEKKNPNFKFLSEDTEKGIRIYLLAGIPNDPELEMYWMLHKKIGESSKHIQLVFDGVEKIFPSSDDHFIFWFKRYNCLSASRNSAQCNHQS